MRPRPHTRAYVNMEMLTKGAISGNIREWPHLKQEVKVALAELAFLRKYYFDKVHENGEPEILWDEKDLTSV